tara:strand:- start:46 stop:381 length:336 start_codon:yes stop_codon:yes gene_type:complete
MENPLLIFIDAADDAAAYPLSRFRGMTVASDATILMQFEASIGDPDGSNVNTDLVTVTCTSDKELKVFKSIAAGINAAKRNLSEGYVVIADDVNSTYVDSDITGIEITLDT